MTVDPVKVLAFDVFGTVVDVRGSLSRALSEYGARRGLEADWAAVADRWADRHDAAVAEVRDGRRAWEPVDALNRSVLDRVLDVHGLGGVSEADRAELNGAWHRLSPWPDAPEGLGRLHARLRLVTLSNGTRRSCGTLRRPPASPGTTSCRPSRCGGTSPTRRSTAWPLIGYDCRRARS